MVTLLIATFVVPLLVPKREREKDEVQQDETTCNIEILRNVVEELTARQTPETRRATRTVVHSYNERIARIKESHGLEDEPNVALRLQALRWERDYVGELIEREEVYPIVGYQYQSRLSHIEKLLEAQRGPLDGPERLPAAARAFALAVPWHRARAAGRVPCPNAPQAMRDVQVKAAEHVMGKLQQAIADSDVPTEDASALLLEYQRTCMALRNANPSITAIARANDKVEDVRRLGLRLGAGADPDHVRRRAPLPRHGEAPARERLPHAGGSGRQRVGRRAGVRDAGAGSALPHARP